jgi:hypothetical protein
VLWLALAASAATYPAGDVPFATGGIPPFPRTDAAIASGAATCQAAVVVDRDGHVGEVTVTGCPDVLAIPLHDALMASQVTSSFAGKNPAFDLVVSYDLPTIARSSGRAMLGEEVPVHHALEDAMPIDSPPEKIFDKRPFVPHGEAGGLCTATVYIDDHGKVYAVDDTACPARLHAAVEMALLAWVYTPAVGPNGTPMPARFNVLVNVH